MCKCVECGKLTSTFIIINPHNDREYMCTPCNEKLKARDQEYEQWASETGYGRY